MTDRATTTPTNSPVDGVDQSPEFRKFKIFPGLEAHRFVPVDLAKEYAVREAANDYGDIDMKNPGMQQLFVETASGHHMSYGGFFEDRTRLWTGFEPDMARMVHLGVDINMLDPGQSVTAPDTCVVCHVMRDPTKFNGWGGRVLLRLRDDRHHKYPFLLLGHLDSRKYLPNLGEELEKGQLIGVIGSFEWNGGWFPHLHIQQMSEKYVMGFEDPSRIDGYAENAENMTEGMVTDPCDLIAERGDFLPF